MYTINNLLSFCKYTGTGNDFVLVDYRNSQWAIENLPISTLCDRHTGVGSDGLLLIENSSVADAKMRIFNADGSEAEMCGNGLRCVADYMFTDLNREHIVIESMLKKHACSKIGTQIKAEMGPPSEINWNITLKTDDTFTPFSLLNTGVPHLVHFSSDIDQIDLKKIAPKFRFHPDLGKNGSNVNFAQLVSDGIKIRTYERGVENETLACGTGSVASALAAVYHYKMPAPLKVFLKSGETLTIDIIQENDVITNTFMTGKASKVFAGNILI